MEVSIKNIALACLVLGLVFQGVQCQNSDCEKCYVCPDGSFQSWFFTEMTCTGACLSHTIQAQTNGTTCSRHQDFQTCRGKGDTEKCDCIRHLCHLNTSTASIDKSALPVFLGLVLLAYQIGVRAKS